MDPLKQVEVGQSSSSAAEGDLEAARRVLSIEADALRSLAKALDGTFSKAVDVLLEVKGRVIVSGMGKSGHVGRKIAATFASTGTPAQHVHPSEASHGDLGMITSADAVVMLSNSGENRELGDLISHTRRAGIPLIAITSNPDSTLARNADHALVLPGAVEACPMGLAPTTSSTMMLALGDALAVALMERRSFTADQYRVLHPGGQLGKALTRVADVMSTGDEVPLVPLDAPMSEIIVIMTSKRFGLVGIVDEEGRLVGVFTDGDLSRCFDGDVLKKQARDVMTRQPKVIRSGALVAEAVNFMSRLKVQCLFVVADGAGTPPLRPEGVIHLQQCLNVGVS